MSHGQDDCHAYIWYKYFKNIVSRNQWVDFDEIWYEASKIQAHHILFK